jgi:FkbM family methyltransferase
MREIYDVVDFAYKNYELTQVYSEIISFSKFYKELNCKNILEIGSLYGGTFYVLSKLSRPDGLKISLDYPMYDNQPELIKLKNTYEKMKTFSDNVKIVTADSHLETTKQKISEILNGEELDFIFIDGDHSYDGVKKDFEMYSSFLKDGGYIAFHDINDTELHRNLNCHVAKFWNELTQYKKIEFNTKSMYMGIGVVQVHKHKRPLNINLSYDSDGKLHIHNMDYSKLDVSVSVRDRDTKIPIYHTKLSFSDQSNGFYVIPLMNYDFANDQNFSGFLVEFYDENKNFIDSKDLKIKNRTSEIPLVTRNYGPFDCLFLNFKQLFYDKIYDGLDIDDVGTVIDVGANVGLFSNYMSWKDKVKLIHAIEPVSKPFQELKDQFYYYNWVKCHKIGIHYTSGKSKINVDDTYSILSTFLDTNGTDKNVEEVDTKTLPEFLDSVNLKSVDLIKMDIEGLEYEVFNTMDDKDILRSSKWIIEYHANDDRKAEILQDRFRELGYIVTNFPDQVSKFLDEGVAIQGFFFAKK